MRIKAQREGNTEFAKILKIFLNSSYGQFGMRDFNDCVHLNIDDDETIMNDKLHEKICVFLNDERKDMIERVSVNKNIGVVELRMYKKSMPRSEKPRLVFLASQITSRARNNILSNCYNL